MTIQTRRTVTQTELIGIIERHQAWLHQDNPYFKGSKHNPKQMQFDTSITDRVNFNGLDFSGAEIQIARFYQCTFHNCSFRNADMRSSDYLGCEFLNSDFTGTDAWSSNFDASDFRGALFTTEFFEAQHLNNIICDDAQLPWLIMHEDFKRWLK